MNIFAIKGRIVKTLVPLIINSFGFDVPPLTSSCAIIKKKDKLLAIDLSYRDGFSLPGGAAKVGETLEDTLRREIKEETNLDVKDAKYLFSNFLVQGKYGNVSACFLVNIKDFSKMKGSEEGKPVWLKPKQILADCAYPDVEKHILKYLQQYS